MTGFMPGGERMSMIDAAIEYVCDLFQSNYGGGHDADHPEMPDVEIIGAVYDIRSGEVRWLA